MTYYKLSYKGVEHVFESLELVNSFKAKNPEWKDVQHTTFEYVPSETKIVPESVPLWSLRSVLREKELLQQVKTSISQIQDNKIKIQAEEGIEYGNTIERSHPITLFIKSVLGLTDNQVDEIFIDAKKNKFMKYLIILFFFVSLTATAQQRITIRSKAAVDSIFKAGDTLKYRIAGTNKSVGTFAGSGGIGSLNGLTGATQTFVNETNIGISSTGTTHTLTWSGTLADGRIASAAKWNAAYEASTKSSYINNGTGSGDTLFRRINDSTGVIARLEFASANNLLSIGTAHDANKLSYNLTINQGNFSLPSIGGSLNLSQINLTGSADNQVLKRVGGALTWATDNTGAGVPTGGTTGQVLTKNSNADNDVSWQSPTGGGGTTYTASGGLSLVGNDFRLGGELSDSTEINLYDAILNFSNFGRSQMRLSPASGISEYMMRDPVDTGGVYINGPNTTLLGDSIFLGSSTFQISNFLKYNPTFTDTSKFQILGINKTTGSLARYTGGWPSGGGALNLQQVTTNGNTTNLNIKTNGYIFDGTNGWSYLMKGGFNGNVLFTRNTVGSTSNRDSIFEISASGFGTFRSPTSYSLFNNESITGERILNIPDSSGTIPVAVYLNGTRYNPNSKGTIPLPDLLTPSTAAATYQPILGFTPYNATNPNNYIPLTALSSTATGLTYTNTTGVFSLTSGYSIPLNTKQAQWDAAYEASTKSSYINNGTGAGDSLMIRLNDSVLIARRIEFTSSNSLLSITPSHDANKLSYGLTVNQGNFSLSSIGGSLNASQIAQGGASSGQVLKWNGSAWAAGTDNSGSVPNGGTTGQVLTKNSNADNDVSWQSPTGGGMADPGANGMVVRTALNTTTSRSITIKDGEGSITNADGVAGNPEIDIAFVSGGFFRFEAEFLNTNAVQSQYIGSAVASGTNTTAPAAGVITPNHPGVILIRSSTTANSGYVYITGTAARMEIGGGEVYNFNFRTPASFTNTTWRAGYHTATNQTDATDGVYFELNGSGAIVGKTANNSTRTTSATITTLSDNTWYHGRIVVNDAKTEAVFTIFDDAGTSLGTQTITTNLPASGRRVGTGLVATNSGTTATDLINIDYMNSFTNKKLTRGAY